MLVFKLIHVSKSGFMVHDVHNGMAPIRGQAIIWTNDGLAYWCIYVSLGLDEWGSTVTKLNEII